MSVFWWVLLCWLAVSPAQQFHPLPVLWMLPGGSSSSWRNLTGGLEPAVRLALQDLKNQRGPLKDYQIQIQRLDSQCDPAKALRALFNAMWAGPKYLLLLGEMCPAVTALIGRALPSLHLVQVLFVAPPPSLSNRKWYGRVFSTAPSERAVNMAAVRLLQRHRWTRVGVVTQDGPQLSEMNKDLMRQLLKADIQVVVSSSLSEDVCSRLKTLKDHDVRIFIAQFEDDSDSEVFCCAYRLKLFGARYQWIMATGGAGGWKLGWRPSGCRADDLQKAADGTLRLQLRELSDRHTAGVSGQTAEEYQQAYLREVMEQRSEVNPLHTFAYDAVWVAARALTQTAEALKRRHKFHNKTLGDDESVEMLLKNLKNTDFQGVTGQISFRNGERMTSIEIVQFQAGSGVLVGEFSISSQHLRLKTHLLKFKGVGPPRDHPVVHVQKVQVGVSLYAVISSATMVTMVTTLTMLCVVTIGYKDWVLSSAGGSSLLFLVLLLLLGLLLCSSSVLFSCLPAAHLPEEVLLLLCSAQVWTLSLGQSVTICVLIGCSWRICSVRRIQKELAGRLPLTAVLLDVLVLSLWQVLDPPRRVELQLGVQSDSEDPNSVIRLQSDDYRSSNMELWISLQCGSKVPLLVSGCLLAWKIRAVDSDHPALGGYQLALSVAAVTVCSMAGFLGSVLTSHSPSVSFGLRGTAVLSCNLFVLLILFSPKVKTARNIQDGSTAGYSVTLSLCPQSYLWKNRGALQEEEEEEDQQLDLLNQQLKSVCTQLDVQIHTLSLELSDTVEPERLQLDETGLQNGTFTHQSVIHEAPPSERDHINSPEMMRRRFSIQLPILHHSYLPVIGGVSSSSSNSSVAPAALCGSCGTIRAIATCTSSTAELLNARTCRGLKWQQNTKEAQTGSTPTATHRTYPPCTLTQTLGTSSKQN